MRMTLLVLMCAMMLAVAGGSASANPFEKGFKAGGDTATYLKNAADLYEDATLIPAPDLDGATAMRLRYDNEMYAEFHPVPVDPATAYALSFQGKWVNPQTLETNATFLSALRETWENGLESVPTLLVEFADASGKKLEWRIIGAMPYGQWRLYRQTFFPPPGAATMQLKIRSGLNDGEFLIANPAFEPLAGEADKVVMTFRQADPNVSGRAFGLLVDDSIRKGPGGAWLVASGSGDRTCFVPLSKPGTYRVSIKGTPQQERSRNVTLTFVGADNKKTGDVSAADLATKPKEFTLPDGTVGGYLTYQHYWLDEVRIERIR